MKIKKIRPTTDEIRNYIAHQNTVKKDNSSTYLTFNQYLNKEHFKNKNINIVVADLSNRKFGKGQDVTDEIVDLKGADLSNRKFGKGQDVTDEIVDLKGGDFSGTILNNTSFEQCDLTDSVFCNTDLNNTSFKQCDLTDSVFCDTDLNNTEFKDTILKNIDFRGADLANCQFAENYSGYSNFGKAHEIQNIKFSTTASLVRKYADIKSENVRKIEQNELIEAKKQELNEVYKELTWVEKTWIASNFNSGNNKYDQLQAELNLLIKNKNLLSVNSVKENKILSKDYVMNPSLKYIFSSENCRFDPAYSRGLTKEARDREKIYVKLSQSDVVQYLEKRKNNQDLSLNDFAFAQEKERLHPLQIKSGAQIIADCSTTIDAMTNEPLDLVNLSGLDFTGANLQGAVFAGAILTGCNFTNANVSKANFEGARLNNVIFDKTNAENTNFLTSDLSQSIINNSNFTHAFLSHSNGNKLSIKDSNFDYVNIKNGTWDNVTSMNSTFNKADLTKISLIAANLEKTIMQHTILDEAILTECNVVKSDFSNSVMNKVRANKSKFTQTILKNIDAQEIDLSESELDHLTKLDEANFKKANLNKIIAQGVSFIKVNLDKVMAQEANLQNAILRAVTMKSANLEGAILEEVKAIGVNLNESILVNVNAIRADFSNSTMRDIKAEQANFTAANFTDTDFTTSYLVGAILEQATVKSARLERVDLRNAKLAGANVDLAKIDNNTNILKADISNVIGDFINNGQKCSPQEYQELSLLEASFLEYFGANIADYVSTIKDLFNNYLKYKNVTASLLEPQLLKEQWQQLQEEQKEYAFKIMEIAGPIFAGLLPTLNDQTVLSKILPNFLKDQAVQHSIIPLFNELLLFNMFDKVDQEFTQKLAPLGANLVASALNGDSHQNIQNIYQNIQILQTPFSNASERRKAVNTILDKIMEIVVTDRMQQVITKDLVALLQDKNNQESFVIIAKNILGNEWAKVFSEELSNEDLLANNKKLLNNSVSLLTNIATKLAVNSEEIVKLYQEYQNIIEKLIKNKQYEQQDQQRLNTELTSSSTRLQDVQNTDYSVELINKNNVLTDESTKDDNPILLLLTHVKTIIDNLSPTLYNDIPKYCHNNKEIILQLFNQPEIQNNIKSYNIDPQLVQNITRVTIPFISDVLPIITELVRNCLDDTDGVVQITEHTLNLLNASPKKKTQAMEKLFKSLINFNNDNIQVKKALEKKIPDLLIKHAEELGPVVEQLLNQTKIGRKIKLKGEELVKTLAGTAPEVITIATSWKHKKYIAAIRGMFSLLLSNKDVLSLCKQATVNLLDYQFQKYCVPNKLRDVTIGKEMNEILNGFLLTQPTPSERIDLAKLFHKKFIQYRKGPSDKYLATLEYALNNKDLRGISFDKTNMKFDNFKINGFNFDGTEINKCSFKGAILQECSFKGATIKSHINFCDSIIDAQTLISLVPVITQYNKEHPGHKIFLDNIKVIGDGAQLDFSIGSPYSNLALSEANIVDSDSKVYNDDLSNYEIEIEQLKDNRAQLSSDHGKLLNKNQMQQVKDKTVKSKSKSNSSSHIKKPIVENGRNRG